MCLSKSLVVMLASASAGAAPNPFACHPKTRTRTTVCLIERCTCRRLNTQHRTFNVEHRNRERPLRHRAEVRLRGSFIVTIPEGLNDGWIICQCKPGRP